MATSQLARPPLRFTCLELKSLTEKRKREGLAGNRREQMSSAKVYPPKDTHLANGFGFTRRLSSECLVSLSDCMAKKNENVTCAIGEESS